MSPNALKQWLDMYDKEGLAGPAAASNSWSSFGSMPSDPNVSSRRMAWAEKMAQTSGPSDEPSFFGGDTAQPAYVQPERMNEPMPQQPHFRDRMRRPVNNFLARLLGGQ